MKTIGLFYRIIIGWFPTKCKNGKNCLYVNLLLILVFCLAGRVNSRTFTLLINAQTFNIMASYTLTGKQFKITGWNPTNKDSAALEAEYHVPFPIVAEGAINHSFDGIWGHHSKKKVKHFPSVLLTLTCKRNQETETGPSLLEWFTFEPIV